MPPRKKQPPGPPALTDDDVTELRTRVAEGEKPRVVVRTASAAVPAGTRGNVIRLGNPSEGEFIVVRLGRDEVPFAPSELSISTRGRRPAAAPAKATKAPARKATPKRAATPRPARSAAAEKQEKPAKPARTAAARADATAPGRSTTKAPSTTTRTPTGSSRRGRTRSASRRAGPPLTVTLRYADDVWTVEAQRGARRIARPTPVRPGAVKAFADLVDEPDVRAAMSETVASSRAVVEERAEKLRAELQAAEAALKEFETGRR